MANIRNLKKDIDFVVYELLSDCHLYLERNPKDEDKVKKIMTEAFQIKLDLFGKIYKPELDENTKAKTYYRNIYKELLERADKSFQELSKLAK